MRTLFLIISLTAMSLQSLAQTSKRNEIKLNTLYLLGGYPELSYERALGNKSAIGFSVGAFIGSPGSNYATDIITSDFSFLPYYRYYFGKKTTSGFFLEGNANIFYREYDFSDENQFGAGLGLALGTKIALNDSWSIGLVAGGGMNFQEESCDGYFCFPDVYPRLGITVGKRF